MKTTKRTDRKFRGHFIFKYTKKNSFHAPKTVLCCSKNVFFQNVFIISQQFSCPIPIWAIWFRELTRYESPIVFWKGIFFSKKISFPDLLLRKKGEMLMNKICRVLVHNFWGIQCIWWKNMGTWTYKMVWISENC